MSNQIELDGKTVEVAEIVSVKYHIFSKDTYKSKATVQLRGKLVIELVGPNAKKFVAAFYRTVSVQKAKQW